MNLKLLVCFTLLIVIIAVTSPAAGEPPKEQDCKDSQPFKDEEDCKKYFQCMKVKYKWILLHQQCKEGRYYDDDKKVCMDGECPPK